jgi:hypothetical protein
MANCGAWESDFFRESSALSKDYSTGLIRRARSLQLHRD